MFSRANPFDESVIAATNENLTVENWELILAVTDKITRASPESARECVAAVEKRLNNKNPNVQLYAIALTEALVKNCDITVHREISSRSFTNTLTKLVHDKTVHAKVRLRILEFIQMCSFEFRADSTLGLMNEVYHSLRAEGIQFPSPQKPKKEFTQSELDKQKEEEEFQLALALSLSESENRPSYRSSATPAASTANTATSNTASTKPKDEEATPQISRVRALYDFQPTEQGELGFEKGDIIRVIESVYRDWWKGELRGKTGIFPVNYVEKIVDPSPSDLLKEASIENEVMNETRNIDRLLEMLSSNDPRAKDSFSDNEELQNLYNSTLSIRPKLVKLIEKYSLKKDELVALNEKFMQARTMYDGMLSNSIARYSSPSVVGYGGYPPSGQPSYQPDAQQQQQQQQQPPYGGYSGYQPYPTQPYGGYQPSPGQPQQQQPQSPATVAAPQHQTPTQQPTYAYNTETTPQVNNAAIPQQQQQQQPQYDYNAQQSPYQPSYDNQQQQPQQTSDYSSPSYPVVPSAAPSQDVNYTSNQQAPQQQNYAAYAPTTGAPEGYPAGNYTSPPQQQQQQQQQYVAPQTTPGYPGQPQQAYNY
ncbi:unnamed protein product [Mucor circinelloides]